MGEEKSSVWIILVSILMLFVSGAWTLATIMPFVPHKGLRSATLTMVTIANVSFLASLLASMLLYSQVGERGQMRSVMIASFSIGILALAVSIVIYSSTHIWSPMPYVID
ncbi:MAG: hypothetical protein JSV18_05945 [Candidatus Bathyarchaeota archaeon]|nr:MAG: hypothetical protein JSV18_05945 [Candidatus Bathyarchaeota archaeon]